MGNAQALQHRSGNDRFSRERKSPIFVRCNRNRRPFPHKTSWKKYQELQPWVDKVDQIRKQTKVLRVYFNNHYGGKAVVNAMQFKEMIGMSLSIEERRVFERAQTYLA